MKLAKENVDDYLQKGIYGQKELKPEEKRRFLGTFRERVLVALYISQVKELTIYTEVVELMKVNAQSILLLNGSLDYSYLSKYVKVANKYKIKHKIVTNIEHPSDLGLILAHENAVEIENIFITKSSKTPEIMKKQKKGLLSYFKKQVD